MRRRLTSVGWAAGAGKAYLYPYSIPLVFRVPAYPAGGRHASFLLVRVALLFISAYLICSPFYPSAAGYGPVFSSRGIRL